MNDRKQALTARGLHEMAAEVGAETGPASTTRAFNRQLIDEFRANAGVIAGELAAANFLLLTTTGVRSGAQRVTPLVYHRIDGRLIVIASTGGGPRNPAWFDNLVAAPMVGVEIGPDNVRYRAVVLSGQDRDEVFAAVVASVATFGKYQERTERVIPVVELLSGDG